MILDEEGPASEQHLSGKCVCEWEGKVGEGEVCMQWVEI